MVDMVGRGGRSEPRRPASCSMTGERLALPPLPRRRSAYEAEGSRRRSSPSLSVPYIHAHTHHSGSMVCSVFSLQGYQLKKKNS
jgi:hypothetical protein